MNKKICKAFTRLISMIIITVMITGTLPLTVLADELGSGDTRAATEYSDTADDTGDQQLDQDEQEPAVPAEEDDDIPADADDVSDISSEGAAVFSSEDNGPALDEEAENNADVIFDGEDDIINGDEDQNVSDDITIPVDDCSKEASIPAAGAAAAAPDDETLLGRLSISRNNTEFPSGDSYVMSEANGKGFFVNYRYSSLENSVLVVECLDYGADFAAIPQTNEFFNQVVKLGQGKLALRFNNSPEGNDCTVNFQMTSVTLTQAQAIKLIDSETVPTSRIAVTEYTLPSNASLSSVLTEGIKGDEAILWEGTPYFNPDATITAPNPFKLTVSPISDETCSLTNYHFDAIGQNTGYYTTCFDGYNNGSYRFEMPGAYDANGSLMEIVGIRLYLPTDLVYLRALDLPGGVKEGLTYPNCQWLRTSFDKYWNDWTIGELTLDPEKNAYYYDLTPPSRIFNEDTFGLSKQHPGMTLRWRLNSITDPLTPDTSYLAENTVITYRLPGDGSNVRTTEVSGSEIVTGKIQYRDPKTTFPDIRAADRNPVSDQNVQVGSAYTNQRFSSTFNSMINRAKLSTLPSYTGEVTQLYEFPYQIRPTVLHLGDEWRDTYSNSILTSQISGIYYNTWESDEWVAVAQETIDKYNQELYVRSAINRYRSIGDYSFPKDVHVKSVRIEWSHLGCTRRIGEGSESDFSTLNVSFDFKVNNWTDKTETETLPDLTQVSVLYRESYDGVFRDGETFKPDTVTADMQLAGQDEPTSQSVEKYLWFRLVLPPEQICPELTGTGTSEYTPYYINGGKVSSVGDLGIIIGKYGERYDYIHDPVITLKLINLRDEIANATDEDLLGLFTGSFTAMPKLSGWTFVYTAENSNHDVYTNSVTIPEITNSYGTADNWLPIPEGYAFTSVVLSYDGELDLSHRSETDSTTTVWLMKNISLRRYDSIPYLDKKIYVKKDYGYAEIRLNGDIKFDITELAEGDTLHCKCEDDAHVHVKDMVYDNAHYPLRVYSTRKASISVKGSTPEKAVIYQGESVGDSANETAATTWDTKNFAVISGDPDYFNEAGEHGLTYSGAYRYINNQKYNTFHRFFPIDDIHECIYIELTDEEFIPNLKNSSLWGYPLTGGNIKSEIITSTDDEGNFRRFLKLEFDKDFLRTKIYLNNDGTWQWRDNGIMNMFPEKTRYNDEGQNVISLDGQLYHEDNYTGPFKLAFDTVPGTTPGDHHPVGMIYYDFYDFITYGHASVNEPENERNGFDRNRTCYVMSGTNIVDDTMSLSGDTSRKFFYQDGSAWTVEVLMHQEIGVNLAPGKNMTYYDFGNGSLNAFKVIDFMDPEKHDLNAFLTITGPGNLNASPIYDMSTVIVIPKKDKKIEYTYITTEGGAQQDYIEYSDPSSMDMYLRGTPYLVSNTTSSTPVLMYTTAEDPTGSSAEWMTSDKISDWTAVTGIRVSVNVMEPVTSVKFRLDLATDDELSYENLSKQGYTGGTFEYRESQDGNFIDPQHLNIGAWFFEGYNYDCEVFWDVYDESGTRGYYSEERGIGNVSLTLYDASGNVIPQKDGATSIYTNISGDASLFAPKFDEGQYIVVSMPVTTDGSVPKMTVFPAGTFASYDRDENKVFLKEPSAAMTIVRIGFVKLPQIQAEDIEMYVGDTVSAEAIAREYVTCSSSNDNNILTNGSYKIRFNNIDESIATFENNGKLVMKDRDNIKSAYSFTGVAPGKFTVDVVLTNKVGDSVTTSFTVTVKERTDMDIIVTNTWDDDNNRDGIRPDGVTVQLMKNGVAEGDPVVLNDECNNTYTWTKMRRYDDSENEIEYTLSVTPIADVPGHTGYTQNVTKSGYTANLTSAAGGYEFTVENIHIPEKVERTVVAVWLDDDNADGIRPGKLEVALSDGSSVTIDPSNYWGITAATLYKYEEGQLVDYTWTAPAVPDGYTFSQTVEGTITTLIYVHERENRSPSLLLSTTTDPGKPLPSTGEAIARRSYLAAVCLIASAGMAVFAVRGFKRKREQ